MKKAQAISADPPNDQSTNESIQAVREVISTFLIGLKNYSLYPVGHTISQKSIAVVKASLDTFFDRHHSVKIDLEKTKLLYCGVEVYQTSEKDDPLIAPLFRDGIVWLELLKGIGKNELEFLFKILSSYNSLMDEPEEDLVTSLWREDLPHIRYKAADVLWGTELKLDFSHISVSGEGRRQLGEDTIPGPFGIDQHESATTNRAPQQTMSISRSSAERNVVELTNEERQTLRKMVIEEESWDNAEDILDVLLISLEDPNAEEGFTAILDILKEEFRETLARGEFDYAVKLLRQLHIMYRQSGEEKIWCIPLLDDFLVSVSSPEVLSAVEQFFPKLKNATPVQIKLFRQLLLLLRAESISTLGPLVLRAPSETVLHQIMEVIGILAQRDLKPLEQLLRGPNDAMIQKLVFILGHVKGKQAHQLLEEMTRHSAERVRREALKQLLKRDNKIYKKIFFLIEDSSSIIRRHVIEYLGRKRSRISEELLLTYLKDKKFKINSDQHILACYRALGRSGSFRSLPFLETTLLRRSWVDILCFRRILHRQGAALALAELEMPEAIKVLNKASRSIFPQVKRAYQNAMVGR